MHGLGAGSLHFAGMLPSCCGFFSVQVCGSQTHSSMTAWLS